MVFGTISDPGAGSLIRLHGKFNTAVYEEILKKHIVPTLRTAINQPTVFMKDNALCHTANSVRTFLSEGDVTVIEWPAQKLDMNPIEDIWKLLNERAKEKNPINVEELWTNVKRKWEKISVDECNTSIRSCRKRCQAVIESKGLHIKY